MPICRAISKYGEDNFKFRVLEECSEESVNEREEHYIREYNTADGSGYNCTYGGEGIKKPKKYWSNHPHSKPVSCYTLEGEWVQDFESVGLACDGVSGKGKSSILLCIKGKTFQAYGYRWAWKGELPKVVETRVNRRGKIWGIHLESGRKKMWNSQADCAEDIHGNRKNNDAISKVLVRNVKGCKSMSQVKGWYLFRDKNVAKSNWTKAEQYGMTSEQARKNAEKSNQKRRRKCRAVSIITGEELRFNSISEGSFYFKGEGDYSMACAIYKNIRDIQSGKTWCHCRKHRWYYI